MWIGSYRKWNPLPDCRGKPFEVEAVHDDWEGFRIWFRSHDTTRPMLIARFEQPLFYASSDEGDRLVGEINDVSKEFPHLFWKVEDSALVAEFRRQAAGVRDGDRIQHFCFLSCNQCVDVLAHAEPTFAGGGPPP